MTEASSGGAACNAGATAPRHFAVDMLALRNKKLLIDGKWVPAASEVTFEVKNPATGATIARAAEGDKADIDAAVRAARRAFESGPWPAMTPSERSKIVWRIGDLISKYADELAELESLDNGKPMAVARVADVPLAADIFQYMAGWCTKIEGKTIPLSVLYTPGVQYHSYTRPEPIGVVGQIIPWNFPAADGGLETRARPCHGLHRGTEGGGRDAAYCAAFG